MNVIVDRRLLKSLDPHVWDTDPPAPPTVCAECGKVPEEVSVELGDRLEEEDDDWRRAPFCLPCLKKAVSEAEIALHQDKGKL